MSNVPLFKEVQEGYFPKWMSDSTEKKKGAQMKKQANMSDDDPAAYKPMPGDTKGEKKLKKSVHTTAYHKKFGKDENMSVKTFDEFRKSSVSEEAEGFMYRKALENIIRDAERALSMVGDSNDLEAWVQDKITISEHNMNAIADYMESNNNSKETGEVPKTV
jgi:hypothetical protein